jgi:hypothetical protein
MGVFILYQQDVDIQQKILLQETEEGKKKAYKV